MRVTGRSVAVQLPALLLLVALLLAPEAADAKRRRRKKKAEGGGGFSMSDMMAKAAAPKKPLAKNAMKSRPKDFDPKRVAAEQDVHGTIRSIADTLPNARLASEDPPIAVIDNFLSAEECQTLIDIGTPGLAASTGTGSFKNGKFERMLMETRTSYNSWLMNGLEYHDTVKEVDSRIGNTTGLFAGNSEHYQVLRYRNGPEFYKTHSDFIEQQVMQPSGPRGYTFFLYLKSVPEGKGGQTFFPMATPMDGRKACEHPHYDNADDSGIDCGVLVQPKMGSAVVWPNVHPDDVSREHPKTRHAALAIHDCDDPEDCVKWAANVWIHFYDFKGAHMKGLTG